MSPPISRRAVAVGLPVAAGVAVLGTGALILRNQSGSSLPLPAASATVGAQPDAPNGPNPATPPDLGDRGGLLLTGEGFPSGEAALQPSSLIDEACLNGDLLSVCISHGALGRHRSLMLLLRQDAPWDVGGTFDFDFAQPEKAQGHIYNNADPLSPNSLMAPTLAYRIREGRLAVRRVSPETVELAFATRPGYELRADPVPSHGSPTAPAGLVVLHQTPEPQRTLRVRMGIELERSI